MMEGDGVKDAGDGCGDEVSSVCLQLSLTRAVCAK